MTQFVLCRQIHPVDMGCKVKRVSIKENRFLLDVASKIFSDSNDEYIFTITFDGKSFDSVCCEAQIRLAEGKRFSETSLFECVNYLIDSCDCLVFWYGNECDDLDRFYDKEGLLKKIEDALSDSSCELYAFYCRQK